MEIEPAIPPSEWPQTHTLDCRATGIGQKSYTDELERDRETEIYRLWVKGAINKVTEVYKAKDRSD